MVRQFSMAHVARSGKRNADGKEHVAKIPKASELPDATAHTTMDLVKPPEAVAHKLGERSLAIGVDIETADWIDQKYPLHKGQFGFFTMRGPDVFNQRIVQIGWSVQDLANCSNTADHDELIVQPDGFEISHKAAKFHGVTTERAHREGLPLATVLERFMEVVTRAHEQGGRLVVHHLEFDAGIIDRELANSGLERWRPTWGTIARQGFCTMDPDVGMWIQMCRGRVLDVNEDSVSVMGLQAIINLLAPVLPATKEVEEFRALNIHTAGADAKMHCLIYLVLREMADKASKSASTDFSLESQKRNIPA